MTRRPGTPTHHATAPAPEHLRRISNSRTDSKLKRPAAPSIEEVLDRLVHLDFAGALAAIETWASSVDASGGAGSYVLFDAICRLDRHARSVRTTAGLSEDRRMLLAQRLGLHESPAEQGEVFLAAAREVIDSLSWRARRKASVERARLYIISNYTRRLPLHEVARAAGISPNYLSHLFRKQCGATLTQFVNQLRVREAVKLIRDGSKSISEIAYLVGYQNYRDFHRNFVRLERSPPRRLRHPQPPSPSPGEDLA
jgi:AraC-like DNA-binding protein